jgi:plasmid maintenance system antidote protein VapI
VPQGQETDTVTVNRLAGILKKSNGKLNILIKNQAALSITLGSNIQLNIHDPAIFEGIGNDKGDESFFDRLRTARKLGEILNNNGLSISVLRKGKKAFTIGRDATPTLSSILTGSDDIQIDSITQAAKLGKDIIKKKTKH